MGGKKKTGFTWLCFASNIKKSFEKLGSFIKCNFIEGGEVEVEVEVEWVEEWVFKWETVDVVDGACECVGFVDTFCGLFFDGGCSIFIIASSMLSARFPFSVFTFKRISFVP